MSIAIFFFTLIIALVVYNIISKEQYEAKEKPSWRKLIYWGTILFISAIFNMLMYIDNSSTYKISTHLNYETFDLVVFLIIACLVIQVISPSILFSKINKVIKLIFQKLNLKNIIKKNSASSKNSNNIYFLPLKKSEIEVDDKIKSYDDNLKKFQEKDFELFLNTLCWLSFSFVIFINIFFSVMTFIHSADTVSAFSQSRLSKYNDVHEQLNYISSIMLLCTLPISFRQIFFYLTKLRKSTGKANLSKEHNSIQYEKYMLIQNNLNKEHKKL